MSDQGELFQSKPADDGLRPWQRSGLAPEREAGIASVSANTPTQWAEAFDRVVEEFAKIGREFNVYDVLGLVGQPEDVHPSAIGARMRMAASRGIIHKIGFAERSKHGDVVTLWTGSRRI